MRGARGPRSPTASSNAGEGVVFLLPPLGVAGAASRSTREVGVCLLARRSGFRDRRPLLSGCAPFSSFSIFLPCRALDLLSISTPEDNRDREEESEQGSKNRKGNRR
jgi:hypothetical protein